MRRPLINYIRQQGGRLPRAVARQPAEDPLRHHPPTWGGHPPGPGTAARFGVDEGRDRHPQTMPTQVRYLEEAVRLRGYEGPIRRIAVTGLGRDRPTLFLSGSSAVKRETAVFLAL